MSATTENPTRRKTSWEFTKVLSETRDRALQGLLQSFSEMLDNVASLLMERAGNTDVREEQMVLLDARAALQSQRAQLMEEFQKLLAAKINDRIEGKEEKKLDFSKLDSSQLSLVDITAMDESVLTSNIVKVVESLCYEELTNFTRAIGHLLGDPDLTIPKNPLAPASVIAAFAEALRHVKAEERAKFAILRELNQTSLGQLNGIYAALNQHLVARHVVPGARARIRNRGESGLARGLERADPAEVSAMVAAREAAAAKDVPSPPESELDIMSLFRRRFGSARGGDAVDGGGYAAGARGAPSGGHSGGHAASGVPLGGYSVPGVPLGAFSVPGAGFRTGPSAAGRGVPERGAAASEPRPASPYIPTAPLAATPAGYVPGTPIIVTPELGEGLSRLQHGESGFDLGGGVLVDFSGLPDGRHNVLRDLQASPLGARVNQLESMTIELVAMLFDFIFETRDLPDGIKALLARLQIPVLKAAMLDGAFFAKKSHPSRLLVNELAQAGLGWSPDMGTEDALYRKIDAIVHRILDDFTDNLAIFEETRTELREFLAAEEASAEQNIQQNAESVVEHDRQELAQSVVMAQVERRLEGRTIPRFLGDFLRNPWSRVLEGIYLREGEESDAWAQGLATLDDFAWSVQPKRATEDRKRLVALLPSLLKRLNTGVATIEWGREEREHFMSHLVEAHAAAVKPTLAAVDSPTNAVAEQARLEAREAKAAGNDAAAAKAEELAAAMAPAAPRVIEVPVLVEDQFLEIARSLERGTWVEFEDEGGQLSFAKLAWISPLRGTYLFTNRQGHKAMSMTAEELAERFRNNRARLVEAEPLIDRAFSTMAASLETRPPEAAAA